MMAGIKNKDTKGELLIRRGLYKLGFRYQLHRKDLPGRPDLVFPKFNSVIFVNGCFWHVHNCHLFKWPSSRPEFWKEKINSNKIRDEVNLEKLTKLGWKVLVIWECALKGKTRRNLDEVIHTAANWIQYDSQNAEIEGKK
ncbi:very short patch repair endonuclease [Cellvibrio zantedeschiae]|uniref:Very short patch repair endonuclease n=2 Tax=Cellvibrio zantedeschiae TaxID=1237077 RepID=A0ABQ3B9E0_9GAMM|nr:very short patch repair endonuclease [Cellvibrio zantedeschiae]